MTSVLDTSFQAFPNRTHELNVTATDHAGNTRTRTVDTAEVQILPQVSALIPEFINELLADDLRLKGTAGMPDTGHLPDGLGVEGARVQVLDPGDGWSLVYENRSWDVNGVHEGWWPASTEGGSSPGLPGERERQVRDRGECPLRPLHH